jgi:hypothetical protein
VIQSDPLFIYLFLNYLIFNKLFFSSDPADTHTRADHPFAFASRMLAAFWDEVENFDQWGVISDPLKYVISPSGAVVYYPE